jgi:hypothetical protein
MYKVIKGKEGSNVNGIILGDATQEELEYFYMLGLPFVLKEEVKKPPPNKSDKKPKKARKADGE